MSMDHHGWEHRLAEQVRITIRPVDLESFSRKRIGQPNRLLWMKTLGQLGTFLHRAYVFLAAFYTISR